MGQVKGHGKATSGIVLQITAMIMLLCTPHLPLLAHALAVRVQPGHCFMDHRLCGCSPERIAARTCCCYRNMKSSETSIQPGSCDIQARVHEPALETSVKQKCCDRMAHAQETATETPVKPEGSYVQTHAHGQSDLTDDDDDILPGSPRLSMLPCGQDSPVISPVTSEMKYPGSTWVPLPTDRSSCHNICGSGDSYLSLSLEPPVPPPKTSLSV